MVSQESIHLRGSTAQHSSTARARQWVGDQPAQQGVARRQWGQREGAEWSEGCTRQAASRHSRGRGIKIEISTYHEGHEGHGKGVVHHRVLPLAADLRRQQHRPTRQSSSKGQRATAEATALLRTAATTTQTPHKRHAVQSNSLSLPFAAQFVLCGRRTPCGGT